MRVIVSLAVISLLLFACEPSTVANQPLGDKELRELAAPARANLKKLAAAAKKFCAKHEEPLERIGQLGEFDAGAANMTLSDLYDRDLGYTFSGLKRNAEGALIQGRFHATPRTDADAYYVSYNLKTDEFTYRTREQWNKGCGSEEDNTLSAPTVTE